MHIQHAVPKLHHMHRAMVLTWCAMCAGEEPSSFPHRRLKPDFSSVSTSPKLQTLLEGLLEPTWEDRLTVKQAQSVLAGRSSPQQSQRAQQARPRPSFGDWGWSNSRDSSAQSSSKRQVTPWRQAISLFADLNCQQISVTSLLYSNMLFVSPVHLRVHHALVQLKGSGYPQLYGSVRGALNGLPVTHGQSAQCSRMLSKPALAMQLFGKRLLSISMQQL